MCGAELNDKSLSVNSQLCRLLGGAKEINIALTGCSNDRIYDTTMEYINNNPAPDFVIIGWSDMMRVQWFLTEQAEQEPGFREVNCMGVYVGPDRIPVQYENRLAHWKLISEISNTRTALGYYWHERIYNLHKYLEYKNIPHVFFHAFEPFNVYQNETKYKLDWNNQFMTPYYPDISYVHWCHAQGYKEITPGWCHYEPAGQLAWATKVYNYIIQHKLLDKNSKDC